MIKYTTLFCLLSLVSIRVYGQNSNLVTTDSIVYQIHEANIGKIIFTGHVIPIENFTETDFLTSFELKEKADLNIRVFLGNSLTNYLHELSPELTANELTNIGNFQFSFYIDGKLIYVENLHHGAFGEENKNKRVVFRVPLISSTNEDSWGRFLWNRFLMSGGREVLTGGEHILKIEIRPYINLSEVVTGNIISEGQLNIIVPEIKINENQVKVQTIKPLKDWEISADQFDNIKIEELNKKILLQVFKDITSIVVIKDGKLLIEEYFNGAGRNSLHDTRSVGKSFASTILGIAINEKYIENETQTLGDFYNLKQYQNYSPVKESITLKSLLTMSSPFEGSDMIQESPGNEENMYPTKNWVAFTLNLPIDDSRVPVPKFEYFTAGVVVLGDIIDKSVPNGLEKYADKYLFSPLGITRYKWQFTPQRVANTAGGLQLRSIDYAKFGQLYKNEGSWNGKQILTQAWVAKSLSRQITISEGEYYGYLFWNKNYTIDNENYEVYYSSGNGGNKICIFKNHPLVIVITSTAYNTPYGHKQADKIIQDYLIPAVLK
ncbi:MAG: serine hydrolase [Bacteroidetes bacterium]|nr:serine hydrolase [Bacteroidota bacterium]